MSVGAGRVEAVAAAAGTCSRAGTKAGPMHTVARRTCGKRRTAHSNDSQMCQSKYCVLVAFSPRQILHGDFDLVY